MTHAKTRANASPRLLAPGILLLSMAGGFIGINGCMDMGGMNSDNSPPPVVDPADPSGAPGQIPSTVPTPDAAALPPGVG